MSFLIDTIFEEYREFVSKKYRQYKTLFRKIKDLRLPKYRLQDYEIKLKDGTELKFYCIYLFNNEKFEVFQEYIEKNLKKEYIRPLQSSIEYPILFISKNDSKLQFYIDYR